MVPPVACMTLSFTQVVAVRTLGNEFGPLPLVTHSGGARWNIADFGLALPVVGYICLAVTPGLLSASVR